ncbi:hypothetical protein [Methylomonas sp. MgM2]
MVELLIKLCEKLIELIQYRETVKKSIFESHIDPIYQSIKQIVSDYRQVLDDAEAMLQLSPERLSDVTKLLSDRRKVLLQAREELAAYSNALSTVSEETEVAKFASICANVINVVVDKPTYPYPQKSILSSLHNALSILEKNPPSSDRIKFALFEVKKYRKKVDMNWNAVVSDYHELKIKCFPI